MCGGNRCHLAHACCGLKTDHFPLTANGVVGQCSVVICAPALRKPTQGTMEDHGEEVVDQRSVPACKQLFFELVVVRHEFVEAHVLQCRIWRSQRLVEPGVELLRLSVKPPVACYQAGHHVQAAQRVHDPVTRTCLLQLARDFV